MNNVLPCEKAYKGRPMQCHNEQKTKTVFFLAVRLCKKTFMMMVDGVSFYFCDDDDDEKC